MKLTSRLAAGLAAMTLTATAAMAADVVVVPPPAPPPPAPVAGFPWAGPYIGAFAGITLAPSVSSGACASAIDRCGPNAINVGALMGYNMVFGGQFLAGVEVRTGLSFLRQPTPQVDVSNLLNNADVNARAGYIFNDKILAYAVAGLGINWSITLPYYNYGAGAELAVGDRMTVFAEMRRARLLGANDLIGTAILMGVTLHNN